MSKSPTVPVQPPTAPPTTTFTRLKSNIKSVPRGWIVFGSLVLSWTALRFRDRQLLTEIQADIRSQAELIANEPLPTHERVRKVAVLLMRPHPDDSIRTSLEQFNLYIKPVFDAAALDYDLVQGFEPGTIQRHVSETVAKKQHYAFWSEQDKLRAAILTTPNDDLNYFYRLQDYDAYVAIGRKPLEEVVSGYVAGIDRAELELQQDYPPAPVSHTTQPSSMWSWSYWFSSKQPHLPNTTRPNLTLPPIAYVPLNTLSGWRTFHHRVYRWFNKHMMARELGQRALAITQGRCIRPLVPNTDSHLGVNEFGVAYTLNHEKLESNVELAEPVLDQDTLQFWPPKPSINPNANTVANTVGNTLKVGKLDEMSAEAIINAAALTQPKPVPGDSNTNIQVNALSETQTEPESEQDNSNKYSSAEEKERRYMELMFKYFVPRDISADISALSNLGVEIYNTET